MTCPTCERHEGRCLYCSVLCGPRNPVDGRCSCFCHSADVEREGKVIAERQERAMRDFEKSRVNP